MKTLPGGTCGPGAHTGTCCTETSARSPGERGGSVPVSPSGSQNAGWLCFPYRSINRKSPEKESPTHAHLQQQLTGHLEPVRPPALPDAQDGRSTRPDRDVGRPVPGQALRPSRLKIAAGTFEGPPPGSWAPRPVPHPPLPAMLQLFWKLGTRARSRRLTQGLYSAATARAWG